MKKFSLIMISFFIAAAMAGCKKEEKKPEAKGFINFLNGSVTIDSAGTKTPAKVGDELKAGMKVITGDKSFADIYFGENAVKVVENSVVEISKLVKDVQSGEKTVLGLESGKIFARVVKKLSKNDEFQVKTPTAVAAIRGTDFVVTQKDNKSNVACLNGKVQVSEAGKEDTNKVDLNQGQEVNVEKDKKLSVQSLKEENLQNLKKIVDDIKEIREDIRKKFEDQKAEIKQKVEEQKDANRQLIEGQKQKDAETMQKQKDADKENISGIKNELTDKKEEIKGGVKNFEKPDLKSVKPQLK